ncbi:hypothetical protein YPPY34_3563, partial [Yersinia pestis PY-34]
MEILSPEIRLSDFEIIILKA